MCTSILDCLLDLELVEFMALVGAVFAGEDFAAGEKLILVWRLRAIVLAFMRDESESFEGLLSRCTVAQSSRWCCAQSWLVDV